MRGNQARIMSRLQRLQSSGHRAQDPSCYLPTAPDAVALVDQIAKVKRLLLEGGTQYIAILGMGGIGKTTLARTIIHNHALKSKFVDGRGFVVVGQQPCITKCQKAVWKSLVGSEKNIEFSSAEEGQLRLQAALGEKCVLLVLDDVWDEADMRFLQFISAASRVIITSRNAEVARCVGALQHDVTPLGSEDAMKVFCKRAFAGGHPSKWQEDYIHDIIRECAGLPLALELMGAAAKTFRKAGGNAAGRRRERAQWKKAVGSLKDGSFESEVFHRVFLLSFDSLNSQYQAALLDLAILPEDYHMRASDILDFWTSKGLSVDEDDALDVLGVLEDRSLIIRTGKSVLEVLEFQVYDAEHYHLHDVVRDSALRLITEEPVLKRDRLVSSQLKDLNDKSNPLKATHFSITESGQQIEVLQDLELLELQFFIARVDGLSELPRSLLVTHLVVMDLTSSDIMMLPPEISCLQSLRLLRLDKCDELKSLPSELGALIQLRIMSMRGCRSIFEIPQSMRNLSSLEKLIAPSCGFAQLPLVPDCLQCLSVLDLSGCLGLKKLPNTIGGLANLKAINLSGCWQLSMLPTNIGHLRQLEVLLLHGCSNLSSCPDSLTCLSNLTTLDVQKCYALSSLPDGIGTGCCELLTLRLQMTPEDCKMAFPKSVKDLENLEVLGLPMRACHSKEMQSMTIISISGKQYYFPKGWTLPDSLIKRIEDKAIILEQEATLEHVINGTVVSGNSVGM